ncbi:hypothetical protein T492DRAFT_967285, partial [Pavlovales sp. CCMP2436]
MSAATRQLHFPPLQGAGPPMLPAHQVRSPEADAASTPSTTKVAHAQRCICSCFAVLLAAYAVRRSHGESILASHSRARVRRQHAHARGKRWMAVQPRRQGRWVIAARAQSPGSESALKVGGRGGGGSSSRDTRKRARLLRGAWRGAARLMVSICALPTRFTRAVAVAMVERARAQRGGGQRNQPWGVRLGRPVVSQCRCWVCLLPPHASQDAKLLATLGRLLPARVSPRRRA